MKPRLSLKGRGIQLLAQREQSRGELRRKLLVHALAAQREKAAEALNAGPCVVSPQEQGEGAIDKAAMTEAAAQTVDELLDWLAAHGYLSDERFVESRVNARAPRFGNMRIRQELASHGINLPPQTVQHLKDTEVERAFAVWQRKFGEAPESQAERARQARFLANRGFSGETIQRVLKGGQSD